MGELGEFLRAESNYYHGRPKAAAILELATKIPPAGEYQGERDELVRVTIQQLRYLVGAIQAAEVQLARLVVGFDQ